MQPRQDCPSEMGFDGVADGVPQVELGAGAALVQVRLHHRHLGMGRLLESRSPGL